MVRKQDKTKMEIVKRSQRYLCKYCNKTTNLRDKHKYMHILDKKICKNYRRKKISKRKSKSYRNGLIAFIHRRKKQNLRNNSCEQG